VAAFAPPTTTPAACSIGLIADVKSDSAPMSRITTSHKRPTAFGDLHLQPQRLHLVEAQPDVLHHQPGGEAEIEAARQDRARNLSRLAVFSPDPELMTSIITSDRGRI